MLPQSAWPAGGERVGIKLPDGTKLSCKPANLSTIGISASVPAAALEVDANPDANTAKGGGGDALPPVICTTDGTPEHVASDPLGLQLTSLFTADACVHDSH